MKSLDREGGWRWGSWFKTDMRHVGDVGDVGVWTGLSWLRIGTGGGHL